MMTETTHLPSVTAEHLAQLQAAPKRPQYHRELLPREVCEAVIAELQRSAGNDELQDLLDRARLHLRAHEALERQNVHRRLRQLRGASSSDREGRAQRFGERLRRLEAEAAENHTFTKEN